MVLHYSQFNSCEPKKESSSSQNFYIKYCIRQPKNYR